MRVGKYFVANSFPAKRASKKQHVAPVATLKDIDRLQGAIWEGYSIPIHILIPAMLNFTIPVNTLVRQNPIGSPNIAPAKRFKNTDPGIANVCLKR